MTVDLKYVYVGQKLQITYEGYERVYQIVEVSDKNDDVTSAIGKLSLSELHPTLWAASWESDVFIVAAVENDTGKATVQLLY